MAGISFGCVSLTKRTLPYRPDARNYYFDFAQQLLVLGILKICA
jgi:hypothetical protein